MAFTIQGIDCMQYPRDVPPLEKEDYDFFNEQYATSSHQDDHDMFPNLIVQPKGDEDIIKTILSARENKIAIAVKSGGHQYSGASSTGGKNIQLDLTNTYRDLMVLRDPTPTPEKTIYVKIGVSVQLQDLNAYLRKHGLFVPTGQCAYVCAGGHGQTGGYGQLGRSFGLFGDYIRSIRLIDHGGNIQQEITKENSGTAEQFYAILGGSPGNFGIITHYKVEVMKASAYIGSGAGFNGIKGPAALKGLWVWNKKTFTALLGIMEKMVKQDPRGFDLCVSVLSIDAPIKQMFPTLKIPDFLEKAKKALEAIGVWKYLEGSFPAIIVCYAQWCPTQKGDSYTPEIDSWFQQIKSLSGVVEHGSISVQEFTDKDKIPGKDKTWDMSSITGQWIFPKRREFDLPYVKRTYSSNATEFPNWAKQVTDRIDLILSPLHSTKSGDGDANYELYNHCKLSVQIQHFGGQNSMFNQNKDNGTSYSWRDSTIVQTLDCFYEPGADAKGTSFKQHAHNFQDANDKLFIGNNGSLSKTDRRLLWGSYGNWDMSQPDIWSTYYENEEKYKRLGKARTVADPEGTFTANPFAVQRA